MSETGIAPGASPAKSRQGQTTATRKPKRSEQGAARPAKGADQPASAIEALPAAEPLLAAVATATPAAAATPGTTAPATVHEDLPADRYLDREQSWVAVQPARPRTRRRRRSRRCSNGSGSSRSSRPTSTSSSWSGSPGLMRRMAAGLPRGERRHGSCRPACSGTPCEAPASSPARHAAVFTDAIQPELAEHGIEILRWKELSASRAGRPDELFRKRIYPVLTPLVVDPAHPFPFISGLSLNLAVTLADPAERASPCSPGSRCRRCCPASCNVGRLPATSRSRT